MRLARPALAGFADGAVAGVLLEFADRDCAGRGIRLSPLDGFHAHGRKFKVFGIFIHSKTGAVEIQVLQGSYTLSAISPFTQQTP
jgi:hypothetical protein